MLLVLFLLGTRLVQVTDLVRAVTAVINTIPHETTIHAASIGALKVLGVAHALADCGTRNYCEGWRWGCQGCQLTTARVFIRSVITVSLAIALPRLGHAEAREARELLLRARP